MEFFKPWTGSFHFGSSLLIDMTELIDMFLIRKSNLLLDEKFKQTISFIIYFKHFFFLWIVIMGEGGIWTLNISVGNSKKCQLTYMTLDIASMLEKSM